PGPAQGKVANPARSGRKQRYRLSPCAAGAPGYHSTGSPERKNLAMAESQTAHLVLAPEWRPERFSELVGQEHVTRTLGEALPRGRIAHVLVFTGIPRVGKTTET